ncbi:DNA repair protein [Pseudoruegeria sp. SHC-113]|uniref:DNA repair protein n=1 Tax=Pseudoruegeria sp. SHC-113 TaxID=2855439 RepID=UPI0021BB8022|nr:DNA repair protein [Pseudoruegeria sp. SHC-113]
MAVALVGSSLLAALGLSPWLYLPLRFGDTVYPQAGMWLQIGVAGLFLALCFYIPANRRMVQLERSHRDFSMTMDDVARAYAISHDADRRSTFMLRSEFDAVRERIVYLRQHPELDTLEPEILQVAAQMSQQSRDIAEIYSDEKVDRAKTFLRQRQQEVERFQEQLDIATRTVKEIKRWLHEVELEEHVVQVQLDRLSKDLTDVLPQIGFQSPLGRPNVVAMSKSKH